MVGALIDVAKGEWTLEELEYALTDEEGEMIKHIVPSSGLKLHKITF
jgi:tRNA U38,U39,U40 pseudouridine synthase TruA